MSDDKDSLLNLSFEEEVDEFDTQNVAEVVEENEPLAIDLDFELESDEKQDAEPQVLQNNKESSQAEADIDLGFSFDEQQGASDPEQDKKPAQKEEILANVDVEPADEGLSFSTEEACDVEKAEVSLKENKSDEEQDLGLEIASASEESALAIQNREENTDVLSKDDNTVVTEVQDEGIFSFEEKEVSPREDIDSSEEEKQAETPGTETKAETLAEREEQEGIENPNKPMIDADMLIQDGPMPEQEALCEDKSAESQKIKEEEKIVTEEVLETPPEAHAGSDSLLKEGAEELDEDDTKKRFPFDIILYCVGGAFVLLLGNYFLFASPEPEKQEMPLVLKKVVQKATKNQREEQRIIKQTVSLDLKGSDTNDSSSVHATIHVENELVKSIDLELNTPEPPELSNEEIVEGVQARPWLRRVVVNDISLVQNEDGSFVGSGKARSYLEYEEQRSRVLSQITVRGEYFKESKSADIEINATYGGVTGGEKEIWVARGEDEKFSFYVNRFLSLKFVAPPEPQADKVKKKKKKKRKS